MNILVIAAHPDDEVLGCGGTIARLSKEGHDVYVAILGEGITSRYENRNQVDKKILKQLHARSLEAGKILGAKKVFFNNLPDNRFDTVPLLDIVKIVEKIIGLIKPNTIYTHFAGDLNIDHSIVNRAVLTATRPVSFCCVRNVYAFEVPSSTEWAFSNCGQVFSPNLFVDISETLELKVKAMQCYKSEYRLFPHPRSSEALRAYASNRGSAAGVKSAEAFQLIRSIN